MSSIKTLHKIKFYGITAKKKYGQNFIFDENILSKIVKNSNITEKINILEIKQMERKSTLQYSAPMIQMKTQKNIKMIDY